MTEQDLAYWLQGAFEIAGVESFTDEQVSCIRRHIDLVRIVEPKSVLAAQVDALLGVSGAVERTVLVKDVVSKMFLHVIDPKHPDPEAADLAHLGLKPLKPFRPPRPPPRPQYHDTLIRC